MMFDGGWGGMGVGWLFMIAFWGALIGVVLWTVTHLFPGAEHRDEARDVLDRRLASGEIDPETYSAIRDQLVGTGRH